MGDVVSFRSKGGGKTIPQLQAEGMSEANANICASLITEILALGIPGPFIRGGIKGGFLLIWLLEDHAVGIEAPNKGGEMWSIHHHDRRADMRPCYELQFTYVGDNKSIAKAVRECISPVDK